jgi:hypothetical protein
LAHERGEQSVTRWRGGRYPLWVIFDRSGQFYLLIDVCFAPKADMAERVMSRGEKHRRSRTAARGDRVQSQLQMRVGVRMPVVQLQRVAEIRCASIDTNASGSNPKRPMH